MTIALGVEIEDIPEVHDRLDEWRRLAAKWYVGDTSDEEDIEAVADLLDGGFRAQSRESYIRFVEQELAA